VEIEKETGGGERGGERERKTKKREAGLLKIEWVITVPLWLSFSLSLD
jgi:hypothetical protein